MASFAHRRQVLLFLLAIVLPCAALVALGVRTIQQERELGQRRVADERRLLTREVRQALLDRLGRVTRDETTHLAAHPESVLSTAYRDPAVVLVARLINGTLVYWLDRETSRRGKPVFISFSPVVPSDVPPLSVWFACGGQPAAKGTRKTGPSIISPDVRRHERYCSSELYRPVAYVSN